MGLVGRPVDLGGQELLVVGVDVLDLEDGQWLVLVGQEQLLAGLDPELRQPARHERSKRMGTLHT